MHNHTGCICLSFIHYVFSYDFSKHLGQSMHSHIGCICAAFLYCAFSNESPNGLLERRRSHIDCICLAFLHCAFSNESSNGLPERMHNRTGCICLTFLRCVFQMLSKIAMLWTSIVTLVAIICLFSTTFLKCILKSPASKDVVPLVAIVWFFTTVCFQMLSQNLSSFHIFHKNSSSSFHWNLLLRLYFRA